MSIDSAASAETSIVTPAINVSYENIHPATSLFTIDGSKLGQVLSEAGYPHSVLKPLVITDNIPMAASTIARYDMYRNKIIINETALISDTRRIYRDTLYSIGETPPEAILEKKDLATKVLNSKVFRTLFPVYWPYNMLKNKYVPYFRGNSDRYRKYFKAATDGTLMPNKPLKEQRDRAKKHISKLMEHSMQTSTAWILSHEYEHIRNRGKKNAIIAALGAAPFILGSALLIAVDERVQKIPEALVVPAIGLMLFGTLLGVAKGRSLDEQASYDAGDKYFARVMDCFQLNHEVFAREVLGITPPTSKVA